MSRFERDAAEIAQVTARAASLRGEAGQSRSLFEQLGSSDCDFARLVATFPWLGEVSARTMDYVRAEALYAPYLSRQDDRHPRRTGATSRVSLDRVDFDDLSSLSAEVRDKLRRFQPQSLGAAARIEGMTPAALAFLAARARAPSGVSRGT